MNVPVPPLFVFESDLAKFEVMDGQQRITAVRDFYANLFPLRGLDQWPELNGRVYEKLPEEIRKGLDRRSISYIVLLKESAETSEEQALLRQQVFERLNTGGVKLSHQEIRNSLYQGPFNDGPTEQLAALASGAVTLEPGAQPHPPHRHPEEEIMIVGEGTGEFSIDGVATQVKTGDMVFAEANVLHGVKNTGATRMTFYFMKVMGKHAS